MPSQPADRPSLPAAVLWDMDGTIVDSEPYWMAEEEALVAAAGGVWRHEDALELVGNDLLVSARIILERTPVTGTPEEVVQQLLDGVIRRMRDALPWRPGAAELLTAFERLGVPSALVTMSWTDLAQVLVDRLPAGTFTTVVTGDQVGRGKPHPDPYLEAARRLGVDPADCLAVEDSPTGAASATAAGVPTVVVPHIVPVPEMDLAVQVPTLQGLDPEQLTALARSAGGSASATA
ncbi:HAD superfamily hydrolase (TIGR01509 family) [Ornithinimicrobium humiphilum]|uniref:HAD superfamily hydrolase (TIGR01509 family) n=1 Tax=Ornithinimicrobium humiphilum TaxID=125288 RepID=A0A543KP93_9MICO|nr:HAD family phosphatase [Ornithinimicrobium humiphilum]TQM96889.1 HAD superfamily hydrolase (TIGR01509 family) [Ornithinimicrobium humiphilum]